MCRSGVGILLFILLLAVSPPPSAGATLADITVSHVIIDTSVFASPYPDSGEGAGTVHRPDSLPLVQPGDTPDSSMTAGEETPGESPGEEPADSAWFMDPELVSGVDGIPAPRSSSPGDISIITRGEIERIRAQTLGELLFWLESAEIIETGYLLDQASFSERGASPQEIVFLLDGVRFAEPTTDLMDLREIPVESIYRIEVIRGPQASIVAGDATEAVINFITARHPGGAARSKISIVDGDGGATIVRGSFSRDLFPKGFVNLSAMRTSVDGLSELRPSRSTQVTGRTAMELARTGISGWISRSVIDRENESGIETGGFENLSYGFSIDRPLGSDTDLTGRFSRTTREYRGDYDYPVESAESGRTAFDIVLTRRLDSVGLLKGGVEGARDRVEYTGGGGRRVLRGSVYGMGSFTTGRRVSVLVGGRIDHFRDHKPKPTAAVSARFLAHDRLRPYIAVAAGRHLSQLGMYDEENLSFESGTEIDAGGGMSATVSYFWRDGGEGGTTLPEPDDVLLSSSGDFGNRKAVRATARYRDGGPISLRIGYTWWNSSSALLSSRAPDPRESSHSVVSLAAFVEKEWKDGNLGFHGAGIATYISAGSAALVDVKLGIRIVDLELFYRARNILDEVYQPLEEVTNPGRYALWGFSWRFLD